MNQSFYPGEDLASHFPLKAALSIFFLALVHHAFMFLCFSLQKGQNLFISVISAAVLAVPAQKAGAHQNSHDVPLCVKAMNYSLPSLK